MHGLLICNIKTGVHACARRTKVSLRDVTIARDGKRELQSAGEDFGRFWKSQLVEMRPASGEDSWLSLAHDALWQVWHEMGGGADEKARIERLCLSLSLSLSRRTFKLKGDKSFVPEHRSRYMFFEFRDSYVLCYICNEQSMYVLHIHVSWLWYICLSKLLKN